MNRIRMALLGGVLLGCGPAFTMAPDALIKGDAGELLALDAGEVLGDAGTHVPADTGTPERDAGELLEASPAPEASVDGGNQSIPDAGELDAERDAVSDVVVQPPPVDAGHDVEPPPPPPALCCATPCSGSQVAAIACASSAPWMCSAGTCEAQGACTVGAVCHWMGATCVGTVEVCP
jgi:hypothetical protein